MDDFNLFLPCGCERCIKSKFLEKVPIPLSFYAKGRTEYQAMLLLQNLALVAQSMGLGGWIHAGVREHQSPWWVSGARPGLGFRFERPKKKIRLPRPYPAGQPNPVGLEACCSPMRRRTSRTRTQRLMRSLPRVRAVRVSITMARAAAPGMKPNAAAAFAREAPHVEPEVIEVVRTICRYIWKTYGRFPAHCHAIDSAGIWMQCHHIDPEFYERYFIEAY